MGVIKPKEYRYRPVVLWTITNPNNYYVTCYITIKYNSTTKSTTTYNISPNGNATVSYRVSDTQYETASAAKSSITSSELNKWTITCYFKDTASQSITSSSATK